MTWAVLARPWNDVLGIPSDVEAEYLHILKEAWLRWIRFRNRSPSVIVKIVV